jgi:hypothetical protein
MSLWKLQLFTEIIIIIIIIIIEHYVAGRNKPYKKTLWMQLGNHGKQSLEK